MRPLLKQLILKYSVSNEIEIASSEWYVYRYVVDDTCTTACICGQENCKYIYTIKNKNNDTKLEPVGSSCMHYFNWDEQEAEIFNCYEKWHEKLYNNQGGRYDKIAFNQIIKDVEYIESIQYNFSAEYRRLVSYAKAVWIHNPPIKIEKQKTIDCEKCKIQKEKGYKMCYQCHIKKKSQ